MKRHAMFVFLLLLLNSCGGSGNSIDPQEVNGTWLFSHLSCDGQSASTSGVSILAILRDGNGTMRYSSANCVATVSFSYVLNGNKLTTASRSVSCSNNGCDQNWTVNGTPIVVNCPNNFGSGDSVNLSFEGSTASVSYEIGSASCTESYIKQ